MSWEWFYALYSISGMILLLTLIWKIAEKILLFFIPLVFNENTSLVILHILSLIPYYLVASFSFLIVIGVTEGETSTLIAVLVGIFILFNDLIGIVSAKNEAVKIGNFYVVKLLRTRYFIVAIQILFYIYLFFDHRPAVNSITIYISKLMTLIEGLPIINWLIALASFLYAIYVIIMAVIAIVGPIVALFFRKDKYVQQDNDYY